MVTLMLDSITIMREIICVSIHSNEKVENTTQKVQNKWSAKNGNVNFTGFPYLTSSCVFYIIVNTSNIASCETLIIVMATLFRLFVYKGRIEMHNSDVS